MLGGAMVATSAVAKEPQTQTAAKPDETALNKAYDEKMDAAALANGTLWGISNLSVGVYITAINTSTSQTYNLVVPANSTGAPSVSLPTGTYDISVSTSSVFANIYISDDDDSYTVNNVYYHTFYNITISNIAATVVAVSYP